MKILVSTNRFQNNNSDEDGFILSTTTKKKEKLLYDNVHKEMTSWTTTSTFDVKKNGDRKSYGRMIVCYRDINDVNSAVFIVRIIVRK